GIGTVPATRASGASGCSVGPVQAQNLLVGKGVAGTMRPQDNDPGSGSRSMKIKPLNDRIVIRRFEAEEKTSGGILLPDSARNKPEKGTVLAVGPGRLLKDGSRRPLQVKEGDTVLFTNWAGDEFKESRGENILLMREEDVLAVLEG